MLGIIFVILFSIAGIVFFIAKEKIGGTIALVIAVFTFFLSVFIITPTGKVGVEKLWNKVNLNMYHTEGFSWINPFKDVTYVSIRTENYTDSAKVLSADGMEMLIDVTLPYRMLPQYAAITIQKFGDNWREVIIMPSVRGAIRVGVSGHQGTDIISTERSMLAVEMTAIAKKNIENYYSPYLQFSTIDSDGHISFDKTGIEIDMINLRDIDPPPKMIAAIEKKLEAEQEAQQMAFTIAKEKLEADRKRIEAQGIQDFQDIVSKGIRNKLLTWKQIEANVEIADKIANSANSKIIFTSGETEVPVILNP